ncbi:RHS repeat-associated core domain-containing protein, partial [Thiolapillus sp.]|uniref:RHS repeat-associated core domain-containing protein n=1 Tax=Thiolapillus sp. TaxID=2017437 RepID=UPI003AF6B406
MAEPAKIATLLMLLSLPVAGQGEPHYAGGSYRGDLVQLGARYLNPRLSRFTTPDPAQQFMSGYQYSAGTPVTLADPSGAMLPEDLAGSIERALDGLENEYATVTENTQRVKAENLKPVENPKRIIRRP